MSRGLSTALKAAVAAKTATFVDLIYVNFSGDDLYLTTAVQDITTSPGYPLAGTQTWTAVGGALGLRAVQEKGAFEASSVVVGFSGVDQAIVAALLGYGFRGRPLRVWLAYLNPSTGAVVDVLEKFRGRMTGGFAVTEQHGGEHPTVSIEGTCYDWVADLMTRRGILTNVEAHQMASAGDTFFAQLPNLMLRRVTWATLESGGKVVKGAGYTMGPGMAGGTAHPR